MTNLLHAILALALILPLIVLVIYVLKRFSNLPGKPAKSMKIIDRLSIGHKEYILVVQIEQEKLVLGVSPHAFNTLHVLKSEQN